MKRGIHRFVLTFITITIVATIGLQWHWNVRNYQENRRQLLAEIQTAFDQGVEQYFAERTKKDIKIFGDSLQAKFPDRIMKIDNVSTDSLKKIEVTAQRRMDSGQVVMKILNSADLASENIAHIRAKLPKPDKKTRDVMVFTTRIVSAIMSDSIDMTALHKGFSTELARRNINLDYQLQNITEHLSRHPENPKRINVMANTTFMPPGNNVRLSYPDPTSLVLQRSLTEIILSLLLSLSIIGSLLYLLKVINRQKKIDEIRNDLIANITHEFKTPITTVISAIEGIRNFNAENDKEKTDRYLDISQRQMEKLQGMVDKLLDTATLDTEALTLQKEPVDLAQMLQSITEKYTVGHQTKVITPVQVAEPILVQADAFHLENAIANIIDNAVKYGGQHINIKLESGSSHVCILVDDDGPGIDNFHRERIFEKFYRIPTGNVHNVKGFGIGLFYSRKIIEKHNGRLELLPDRERTTFKVTLPYA